MNSKMNAPRERNLGGRIVLGIIGLLVLLFGLGVVWKLWINSEASIVHLPIVENFGGRNPGIPEQIIGIIGLVGGIVVILMAIFKKQFN